LLDNTHLDWLPTINIGHKENCVCSFCHPKTTERHDRAHRRADKQRTRESVILRVFELILQETVDSVVQSAVENEVRGILEEIELINSSLIKIVDSFIAEFVDSCLEQSIKEEMHKEIL